jgi:hypothetical protein
VSANDHAGYNNEGGGRERIRHAAERSAALAVTRDGQMPWQHGRQNGSEGKFGSAAAAMRPEGVQSNGDERGHTHVLWAALDKQTKSLQERYKHGESS